MGLRDNWVEFKLVNGGLVCFEAASIACIIEQVAHADCGIQMVAGVNIQRQNGHRLFLDESYNDVKAAMTFADPQALTSESVTDNGGEKKTD